MIIILPILILYFFFFNILITYHIQLYFTSLLYIIYLIIYKKHNKLLNFYPIFIVLFFWGYIFTINLFLFDKYLFYFYFFI